MYPMFAPGPAWRALLRAGWPALLALGVGAPAHAQPTSAHQHTPPHPHQQSSATPALLTAVPAVLPAAEPPATAASATSPLRYQSPFAGYQRFDAPAVGNWRQANDTVRDIGGWRTYLREAQGQGPAPASGQTPSAGSPTTAPHAGHGSGGPR